MASQDTRGRRARLSLAELAPLLGRHLHPALAELLPLLRGHRPPALPVALQAGALLRRHRLVLMQALHDGLAPLGRELLEVVVGILQLALALGRQRVPPLEVLEDPAALLRWELPHALTPLPPRFPFGG